MSITFTHRDGEMSEGSEAGIPALLSELDGPRDDEHPDVSVSDDESAWSLSAFQTGGLVFENLDDDVEPRHMEGVSREETVRIMAMMAREDFEALEALEWSAGYLR
ncbi:hypothetical protein ACH4MA_29255 [Streptomyces roseolus]|uniref:hypothetical protein n=1 Tax=Streptomyces roseolus TaxID=67358 RepID=UPI0037AD4F07